MPNWSKPLPEPIRTRDGTTLQTLDDVRAYILALPKGHEQRNVWLHTAGLLLADPVDVGAVAKQLRLALLISGKLDMG